MKKNAKKKALATLVALVLVIACAVGATFAWFTDTTEAIENTFTVGNVDIVLYESNAGSVSSVVDQDTANDQNATYKEWLEPGEDGEGAGLYILPGSQIAKDTIVKNIGANAAWVRIIVTVPEEVAEVVTLTADTDDGAKIKLVKTGENVYTYYMTDILNVGAEFVVDNTVKIATTAVESDFEGLAENIFKITVKADAIQAQGLTFEEAWEAFADPSNYDDAANGYVDEPTDPQL